MNGHASSEKLRGGRSIAPLLERGWAYRARIEHCNQQGNDIGLYDLDNPAVLRIPVSNNEAGSLFSISENIETVKVFELRQSEKQ